MSEVAFADRLSEQGPELAHGADGSVTWDETRLVAAGIIAESFHVAATDRKTPNDHRSRPSNMSHQDLGV